MKITRESISDVVIPLLEGGVGKVVKYLDKRLRLKATRKRYKNNFKGREIEIALTIGHPNCKESKVVRNALKEDKDFLKNKSLIIFLRSDG